MTCEWIMGRRKIQKDISLQNIQMVVFYSNNRDNLPTLRSHQQLYDTHTHRQTAFNKRVNVLVFRSAVK